VTHQADRCQSAVGDEPPSTWMGNQSWDMDRHADARNACVPSATHACARRTHRRAAIRPTSGNRRC